MQGACAAAIEFNHEHCELGFTETEGSGVFESNRLTGIEPRTEHEKCVYLRRIR